MSGVNFVDTIVVRRSLYKGTQVTDKPVKNIAWVGPKFRKHEEERLNLAGNPRISSSKGTRKMELSKMYKSKIPDLKGHYVVTGKGTGRRILA